MHYLNNPQRQALVAKNPSIFTEAKSRVLAFVNLAIHPYKFEIVYEQIRQYEQISRISYDCLKGTITALLVLINRKHRYSYISVDEYIVDFVKFIRSDNTNDPVKFLLSMKAYMLRYLFIRGLKVAFGLEWSHIIVAALGLKRAPNCKTYHSLLTNIYVRNLLRVYVVWKNYRDQHDEDYELGKNDCLTLLKEAAKMKTSLPEQQLVLLFDYLQANLPSWNYGTRRKASYAIDTCQDGWGIMNRQFSDYRYKLTQG